jgi:pyruvate/2-oxoglutarate dehydrogenase complex dihydrolipoamide dehydrogenase (E3) component
VITAVGVIPNVENLNLAEAGVSLDDKGFIAIDDYCQTSVPGINAIGDVVGAPCLAHKASHEAIFDQKTGELLGAHLVGSEVTELIQGFAVAKTMETTEEELMQTIFPHPTLSEMIHESVLDAYGRGIHI